MQRGLGPFWLTAFVVATSAIAWAAGRLDQRLFDDEVLTLAAVADRGYGALLAFYVTGQDVHPPLSFLWFRLLQDLAVPIEIQRLLSFLAAAAGFGLVLDLVWRRVPPEATATRALAIVLFLGAPLLYGMGAALRWYPLLVLPVAVGIRICLTSKHPPVAAALAFALAANISFLAFIPVAAYLIWRIAARRRFDAVLDVPFLAVFALGAMPAIVSFALSLPNLPGQFGGSSAASFGAFVIGLAGGYGLGLTQSVLALPLLLLAVSGLLGGIPAIRRPVIGDLLSISLLVAMLAAGVAAAGLGKPRSFLFALPFIASAIVLGGYSLPWRRFHAWSTGLAAFAVSLASLMLLQGNDRPFKRNLHLPDEAVLADVRREAPDPAETYIVSSEVTLAWRLRLAGYCVLSASLPETCAPAPGRRIVTIDDGNLARSTFLTQRTAGMTRDHRLVFQKVYGDDRDAATKTFLGGALVPAWLVGVAVYAPD